MEGFIGSSPDELDALARACDSWGQTLDGTRRALNSQVHNAGWIGPHADEFIAAWGTHYLPGLSIVEHFSVDMSTKLEQQAALQRWASDAFGGAGSSLAVVVGILLRKEPQVVSQITGGHRNTSLFSSLYNDFNTGLKSDEVTISHDAHSVAASHVFQDILAAGKVASLGLAVASLVVAVVADPVGDVAAIGLMSY